jgi:hypothetical protein
LLVVSSIDSVVFPTCRGIMLGAASMHLAVTARPTWQLSWCGGRSVTPACGARDASGIRTPTYCTPCTAFSSEAVVASPVSEAWRIATFGGGRAGSGEL